MATAPNTSSTWWSQLPFSNFLRMWDFRPNTQWLDHFITINWRNSGDAPVEQHVLGEVGSYGFQLSRILDAVNLLVSNLDLAGLAPDQQKVVVRLQDLATQVDQAVQGFRGEPRPSEGDPTGG